MNDILKQRLVGALILIALGVVFWPIIFVEPGDEAAAELSTIPPRPGVDTAAIEAPDLAGLRASPERAVPADEEPVQSSPAPEPEPEMTEPAGVEDTALAVEKSTPAPTPAEPVQRTRSKPPEKLAIDGDGVPVAWILQVASVSDADKAEQLRRRLLEVDKKAYVKKVRRQGKDLYRVYIGPKFERAGLEAMQSDIDTEFGVKSMIARYIP